MECDERDSLRPIYSTQPNCFVQPKQEGFKYDPILGRWTEKSLCPDLENALRKWKSASPGNSRSGSPPGFPLHAALCCPSHPEGGSQCLEGR
jgi:hypothetical protein